MRVIHKYGHGPHNPVFWAICGPQAAGSTLPLYMTTPSICTCI